MQYLMFLLVIAVVALSVTAAAPRSSSSSSESSSEVVCEDVTSTITCTSTGGFVMCDAPGDISAIAVNTETSTETCLLDSTFGFIGDQIFVSGGCDALFDVTYEVCTGGSSSDSSSS